MLYCVARHSFPACAPASRQLLSHPLPPHQATSVIVFSCCCCPFLSITGVLFQSSLLPNLSVVGTCCSSASPAWPCPATRSALPLSTLPTASTHRRWTRCQPARSRGSSRPASPTSRPGTVRTLRTVPDLHLQHAPLGLPDVAHLLPAAALDHLVLTAAQVAPRLAVAGSQPLPAARPRLAPAHRLPQPDAARDQVPAAAQVRGQPAVVLGLTRILQLALANAIKPEETKVTAKLSRATYQPVRLVPPPNLQFRLHHGSIPPARVVPARLTHQVVRRLLVDRADALLAVLPGPAVLHRPQHCLDPLLPQHSLALR